MRASFTVFPTACAVQEEHQEDTAAFERYPRVTFCAKIPI